MKSFSIITACLLVAVTFTLALAAGKVVIDPNNKTMPYHSPDAATAACTTTTTTKGTIATATTAGFSTLCWEASDSTNAAKRIRRHLNSNTAYMPATGGCFALNSDITSVVFKPYSAVSAAYTVCIDKQKGGKTP